MSNKIPSIVDGQATKYAYAKQVKRVHWRDEVKPDPDDPIKHTEASKPKEIKKEEVKPEGPIAHAEAGMVKIKDQPDNGKILTPVKTASSFVL